MGGLGVAVGGLESCIVSWRGRENAHLRGEVYGGLRLLGFPVAGWWGPGGGSGEVEVERDGSSAAGTAAARRSSDSNNAECVSTQGTYEPARAGSHIGTTWARLSQPPAPPPLRRVGAATPPPLRRVGAAGVPGTVRSTAAPGEGLW
eukprot:CAMPEP_0172092118 /NCGR_PEP_ID=MMETSP1043-20130122/25272_1 /TAXON_ID=464988 /ORGANISM="Hemiselmis andersenii, Strain CCMP441" /LENGTH=146 /DNA_ID=CAMNT_0012754819 /DNA_START=936 /DNA_END=1373 /DNA_ORIENTATION=+